LLSGTNSSLCPDFKAKYRFKGMSLFYNNAGGISFNKMWNNNSLIEAFKNAYSLPVQEYDLVINDFDFITALACKIRNVKSVQFGHQASFQSDKVPRPTSKNVFYEFVLQHFAEATEYVGLHFQNYDVSIFNPVIKDEILEASVENKGHVTIYLPSVPEKTIVPYLKENKNIEFHLFSSERKTKLKEGNIHYMPVESLAFTLSMLDCQGVITGGGFETPSETLYLQKKLMAVPIRNHYEQLCNAAALQKMGVHIEYEIKKDFGSKIMEWVSEPNKACTIIPNNISQSIDFVVNKGIRA
jgi:uncharacterized protein (TIGR00661 family)